MSKAAITLYFLAIATIIGWIITSFVFNRPVEVPTVSEETLVPIDGQLELQYLNDLQARSENKITPELEL